MKILAPVNNSREVKEIIQAGADELYCGIIPKDWLINYGNMASLNRREWKTANLTNDSELDEIVNIAHAYGVPVYLTLNALYTQGQYPLLYKQVEQYKKIGVDALIIADLGLLLNIKKQNLGLNIHISTGGTTFNSCTVEFFREFGASRIVLPRHLQVEEIRKIVKNYPSCEFEVFILNSGCKNIDGFCTFHHGINEIFYRRLWNLPKKLNFDRHLLNLVRQLPKGISRKIKTGIFGIDSACLLNYKVSFSRAPVETGRIAQGAILKKIASNFNLLSAIDTCGVCRLFDFKEIGIYGLKIVGRNYSTEKKLKDIVFLKTVFSCIKDQCFEKKEFYGRVRKIFKRIYRVDCGNLCYYSDEVDL